MYRPLLLIILICSIPPALALPTLGNLAAVPQHAYIGDNISLSFTCYSSNSPTATARGSMSGAGIFVPNLPFTGGPTYTLQLDRAYLDRIGEFSVLVFCADPDGETNVSTTFTVSKIAGQITKISPQPAYGGDLIDLDFSLQKNDAPVSSDVTFLFSLNGQEQTPESIIYDTNQKWIVRFNAPQDPGTYALRVRALYGNTEVSSNASLVVQTPIEFRIAALDKQQVVSGDNVSISFSAFDHGSFIPLNAELRLDVDGSALPANQTGISNGLTIIKTTLPIFSPGTHTLRATFPYRGQLYIANMTIWYVVPITGQFVSQNRALNVQTTFVQNGAEALKFSTDTTGSYSSGILPGTYDIIFQFPESKLALKDVRVERFSNPIKYAIPSVVAIPGMNAKNMYLFRTTLSFSSALIEIPYADSSYDENSLQVFSCSLWDDSGNNCTIPWTAVNAGIDRVQNVVTLQTSSLATYALGSRESLGVSFMLNKKIYPVHDTVQIKGKITDNKKNPVPGAHLDVALGSSVIGNIISDQTGSFTIEFLSPDNEGSYPIRVSASQEPYVRGEQAQTLVVEKEKSVSLLFPDAVRIPSGTNATKELIAINTGQEDLKSITLTVLGVPQEYYTITQTTFDLPIQSQQRLPIIFSIPPGTTPQVFAGTIQLTHPSVKKEKQFGLTVEEKTQVQTIASQPLTGYFISASIPAIAATFPVLGGFALLSFSGAFLLKLLKKKNSIRYQSTLLFDLKNHIHSRERPRKEQEDEE